MLRGELAERACCCIAAAPLWACLTHEACWCVRVCRCRLIEVINDPSSLYLVFEWVDKDLKKYMDKVEGPMPLPLIKVTCRHVLHRGCSYCIMSRAVSPLYLSACLPRR